jgi:hypothetical protein
MYRKRIHVAHFSLTTHVCYYVLLLLLLTAYFSVDLSLFLLPNSKTIFLALSHAKTKLKFSALIGINPVLGTEKSSQLPPGSSPTRPPPSRGEKECAVHGLRAERRQPHGVLPRVQGVVLLRRDQEPWTC